MGIPSMVRVFYISKHLQFMLGCIIPYEYISKFSAQEKLSNATDIGHQCTS